MSALPAIIYGVVTVVAVLFQLALALGAPWGHLAMGGKFPGKFPPALRVSAVIQGLVLLALAAIVFIKSGLLWATWLDVATTGIWVVVAFSAVALIMNLATPNRWERIIWAPVGAVMLTTSLIVALSKA